MAAFFSALNGVRCRSLLLTIPARQLWTAQSELESELDLESSGSDAVTLELGGLSLAGFAYRGGSFTGVGQYRIVGGAGGWGNEIAPKFYRNPFGVKLSLVLGDAAAACGERISVTTDAEIGQFFMRRRGPASTVLGQLSPNWWVRQDGVVVTGEREESTIASVFDVMQEGTNLGTGRFCIATDFPEDWIPGRKFSSPVTGLRRVSIVQHHLSAGKLRTMVWTG